MSDHHLHRLSAAGTDPVKFDTAISDLTKDKSVTKSGMEQIAASYTSGRSKYSSRGEAIKAIHRVFNEKQYDSVKSVQVAKASKFTKEDKEMNLLDLIKNKNLKEANALLNEKLKEIVEAKLLEVKKMINARQFNENDNSGNGARYNYKGNNMKAFDTLPKAIRQSLANSDQNWSAGHIKKVYKKDPKLKDIKTTIATIKDQDKKKHDRDAEAGHVMGGQR